MTGGVIFLIVVLLVVVGVAFYAVSLYNGFVRSRNLIQESWRQIDVELNRRYDLIPNLVETVRAYAAHERNTLEGITRLRNQAAALAQGSHGGVTQERAQVEEQLSGAVRNLLVSVEAYPDPKSHVHFLALPRAPPAPAPARSRSGSREGMRAAGARRWRTASGAAVSRPPARRACSRS